jgi:ABC-type branched-subunit amino acid transport system ATPase component
VAPGDITPLLSLDLFAAVLIGGRRLAGPLLGVGLVLLLPTASSRLSDLTGGSSATVHALLTALLLVVAVAVRAVLRDPPASAAPLTPGDARVVPRTVVAQGVSVRFSGVQALDGVDLDLCPGQVHALIGPNGSGKTTLLRVLAGDVRPDAGSVTVDGVVATRDPEWRRVRRGVARTPQHTVDVAQPARDQLRAAARARDPRRAVLAHLVGGRSAGATTARRESRAATGDVGPDRDATTLRLLQVGRVAATGAGAVLLDEPAAGVTAAERSRVVDAVRALAAEGRAVLLVEHDMRLVGAVAERVTVLAAGRVLASGTVEEIRSDPAVVAAYLGASGPTLIA